MSNSHEFTDTKSVTFQHMFGMSLDDMERKIEEHSIYGKDYIFMSTNILSDIQAVIGGLDDPTGVLECTRQRLNTVKYILGQYCENP